MRDLRSTRCDGSTAPRSATAPQVRHPTGTAAPGGPPWSMPASGKGDATWSSASSCNALGLARRTHTAERRAAAVNGSLVGCPLSDLGLDLLLRRHTEDPNERDGPLGGRRRQTAPSCDRADPKRPSCDLRLSHSHAFSSTTRWSVQ
jgi:hypothetical protein